MRVILSECLKDIGEIHYGVIDWFLEGYDRRSQEFATK